MQIRPLHDWIVVKRSEEPHRTAGGIVIPETAAEKQVQGEVIAVGKGKHLPNGRLLALDVEVGEVVLFGRYAGNAVKILDQEFLVMREDDVLGIIQMDAERKA